MGESVFAKCICCCSAIEIESETDDEYTADGLPVFNVSLWTQSDSRPLTKKERQRWCDHILKTGKPWADHTILTSQDAQRLAEFVLTQIKYAERKNSSRSGGVGDRVLLDRTNRDKLKPEQPSGGRKETKVRGGKRPS